MIDVLIAKDEFLNLYNSSIEIKNNINNNINKLFCVHTYKHIDKNNIDNELNLFLMKQIKKEHEDAIIKYSVEYITIVTKIIDKICNFLYWFFNDKPIEEQINDITVTKFINFSDTTAKVIEKISTNMNPKLDENYVYYDDIKNLLYMIKTNKYIVNIDKSDIRNNDTHNFIKPTLSYDFSTLNKFIVDNIIVNIQIETVSGDTKLLEDIVTTFEKVSIQIKDSLNDLFRIIHKFPHKELIQSRKIYAYLPTKMKGIILDVNNELIITEFDVTYKRENYGPTNCKWKILQNTYNCVYMNSYVFDKKLYGIDLNEINIKYIFENCMIPKNYPTFLANKELCTECKKNIECDVCSKLSDYCTKDVCMKTCKCNNLFIFKYSINKNNGPKLFPDLEDIIKDSFLSAIAKLLLINNDKYNELYQNNNYKFPIDEYNNDVSQLNCDKALKTRLIINKINIEKENNKNEPRLKIINKGNKLNYFKFSLKYMYLNIQKYITKILRYYQF